MASPASPPPATEPTAPAIQILTPNSPPASTPRAGAHTVFLAGPTNLPWRAAFLALLAPALPPAGPPLAVYDPVQPRWDASWREDDYYAADDAAASAFRAQTDWELARLAAAATVVVWLDARAAAPVSLLELGLVAASGRAVVGCQPGFWKRGNVQAVCARLGVPLEERLEGLVARVVARVSEGGGEGEGVAALGIGAMVVQVEE